MQIDSEHSVHDYSGHGARNAWIMVAVLIVFYILNAFDRTVLSLMVGHVKEDMNVSDSQIGLMLGLSFALFYGVFAIPIGILADRYSKRVILFFGVAGWSLATVACGFAANYGELLIARMALGIGEASLMPAAHSLIAQTFPPARRGTAMSVFFLGGVSGNSLSVALGGAMIAYFSQFEQYSLGAFGSVRGWQVTFVIVGVFGVLSAALAFVFREPALKRRESTAAAVPFLPVLRRRVGILLCILGTIVVYAGVLFGTVLWTPTYMARAFGWNPAQVGLSYSLVHLFGTGIGTVLTGMVVDRVFAKGFKDAHLRVFLVSVAIGGSCGVLAFAVDSPYIFLGLLAVLHFFGFAFSGTGAALVQTIAPAAARARMAALYVLTSVIIGNGFGPWIVGLLTDKVFADEAKLGWSIGLLIGVGSLIAISSAAVGLRHMREAVALTEAEDSEAAAPAPLA
jgi:MFS family permease